MRARVASLLALALSVSACRWAGPGEAAADAGTAGTGEPPFPVALTREQSRGLTVYADRCASCHGPNGRGDTAEAATHHLPDLTDKRYGSLTASALAARFEAAHRAGLPAVLSPKDTQAALRYVPLLSYPPDAPGSAVAGRRLYGRYCTSCHGVRGDGNGPAAALLDTPPTPFTIDTLVAARDFAALADVTKNGPGHAHTSAMPAWGLFFDARMLNDVAAYLPTFQTGSSRPKAASAPTPTSSPDSGSPPG